MKQTKEGKTMKIELSVNPKARHCCPDCNLTDGNKCKSMFDYFMEKKDMEIAELKAKLSEAKQ